MENAKEYYCWIRAVATVQREEAPAATGGSIRVSKEALTGMSAKESAQFLRNTCPAVTWLVEPQRKPTPAPPTWLQEVGPFQQRVGHLLGAERLMTAHLEQPEIQGDLQIDFRPVRGSRLEALAWLETPPGIEFAEGAKAMGLFCLSVADWG